MLFSLGLLAHAMYLMLRVQGSGGTFPKPLSAEEEADCIARMAAGDAAARDTLIEHNLRLVAHIAKKYYAEPAEQDDLISIGTIGLIKAVGTYKSDKKVRLATYAARCIENPILSPMLQRPMSARNTEKRKRRSSSRRFRFSILRFFLRFHGFKDGIRKFQFLLHRAIQLLNVTCDSVRVNARHTMRQFTFPPFCFRIMYNCNDRSAFSDTSHLLPHASPILL